MRIPHVIVLLASFFTPVMAVFAQASNPGLQPVDQAVGDLGPNSVSLRRVEPGLQQFGRAAALQRIDQSNWQRTNGVALDPLTGLPMPQGYVYTAPGYRAYFPQAEYVVRSRLDPYNLDRNVAPRADGEYAHLAPANMVYDLVYRNEARVVTPLNPAAVDRRLDTRLDPRLVIRRADTARDNIDYVDGVSHHSANQALLDHYRGDNRQVGRVQPNQLQRRPIVDVLAKPPAASRAQQPVVDQADAPEPRRDERDHAAGE